MIDRLFELDGRRVSRLEDAWLITGAGTYASDWNHPDQLYGYFARSDRAHAKIVRLDATRARSHDGVVGVFTGDDALRAGYVRPPNSLTFAGRNGMRAKVPERPALAAGRVRFVGEPLALVVAESALAAQDAAELIEIEYEDLPCIVAARDAFSSSAPRLHENIPGNLPFEYEAGDEAAVEAAFARAAHVARIETQCTRVTPSPMEPRACLVSFDSADESYAMHVCLQGINTLRKQIADYTGVPEDKLKLIARDVGGGFGQRTIVYPEYCALMLAARMLHRPVKWVSTRSEGFASDTHGRASSFIGELALDRDGRFLAMRFDWVSDVGAYLASGGPGYIRNPITCMTGVYFVPALYGRFRVALTNTAPVSSYRGAGRPDIAYAIERLVNRAAAQLRIDAAELRRRNFIPVSAFPYKTPTGSTYEYADFHGLLEKAVKLADYAGFEARRASSVRKGKLRGIGISTVIEASGAGTAAKDEVELAVDGEGRVTVFSPSKSQGRGHETTLAMIVADALDIATERVIVRQSMHEKRLDGNHTGGSRTMVGAGSACKVVADMLIELGKSAAAEEFGTEPSQVEYDNGEFRSDDPARGISLAQLAQRRSLAVHGGGKFGSTFPNGCHIAEVEIDPETGAVRIDQYVAVDDCGTVINHALVEGQLHGGIAQGAGQVVGEHIVYDVTSGQLLTGSFADYFMPRAGLLPDVRMAEHATPSKVSPLGVKGVGESGCTASLGAIANAVIDALRPLGVTHLDMPMTPAKVWQAIVSARVNVAS